ncbi:sensor histidine kinase [Thalassotalea euphylliae]|uniref:histidine kinase n=1 Tax=Thalassotalea euphylliae TaxID=1655234 RepID=A0A3E0TR44_9GAMM|nr:HAMP domain-containing sensor histidine kinase [Thalassotalea euphylliae]REL26958.1 sensor histidine kinase [Thalassotalea euphylliae]
MKNTAPISRKIRKVYFWGAFTLLVFYTLVFNLALLFTEDSSTIERLKYVAPDYLAHYENGDTGIITVDSLVTLYDSYDQLPPVLKPRLDKDWHGVSNFFFEDDSELNVFAQLTNTPTGHKITYAVERIGIVEVNEFNIALLEISIFVMGLVIFLIIARVIISTLEAITLPFIALAKALENNTSFDNLALTHQGSETFESHLTLTAVNQYRTRIAASIEREQNFTRYVSHELRTPMSVIKGCTSLLRASEVPMVLKQCGRIDDALNNMAQLTQTFLMLARNKTKESSLTVINTAFISEALSPLHAKAHANDVTLDYKLLAPFELTVEPLLMTVLIQNITINAINCSHEGSVSVFITHQKLEIVDNGVGLNATARGYEGFGIGLQLVEDICKRYQWQFSLQNNVQQGCTATVLFAV